MSKMTSRRTWFNLNQVVDMLEDDSLFLSADIFIDPPPVDTLTDEDSGDEDAVGEIHNLNGRQLSSFATANVMYPDGRSTVGSDAIPDPDDGENVSDGALSTQAAAETSSSDEIASDNEFRSQNLGRPSETKAKRLKSSRTRARRPPPPPKRSWQKVDLSKRKKDRFTWTSPAINTTNFPQDPVALFKLFYDEDVIDLIVQHSISYAAFKGNHAYNVSPDEIRTFLAILLISGYSTVPRRRMYWSNETDVHNTAIASAMTRDRFDEIMRFCHVSDNTTLDAGDKMAKVRPLLTMINERCLTYFIKQQEQSIDESMIPYYGRHGAKQFIRGKPIRFGYKMWALSTPLGYVIQFEPYQGVKGRQPVTQCPGVGMGGSVIIDLIAEIQGNDAYHLTFDNLFTSLKLVDYLSTKGIACTGTIRSNRIEDCPLKPIKEMQKMPRGTYDYYTDTGSGLIVVRWHDNNIVNIVSNKVGVNPLQSASRWSRPVSQRVNIPQPFLITHYNKTMGGINRMDQNIDKYRVAMRSKKWWWPVFSYCLDLCVQQAWHLYRATPTGEQTHLDLLAVRRAIASVYLARSARSDRVGRSLCRPSNLNKRVPRAVRLDGKNHLVECVEKQIRCAACGKKSRQKCGKYNVGLHNKCFVVFHTQD